MPARSSSTCARSFFTHFLVALSCTLLPVQTLGGALPTAGTTPSSSSSLSLRQKVWQAVLADLRERDFHEADLPRADDLDLPAALPDTPSNLHVTSACWDERPQRLQIRLGCADIGACLPFLVFFHRSLLLQTAPRTAEKLTGAGTILPHSCRQSVALSPSTTQLTPTSSPTLRSQTIMRIGDRVTAIFRADHLRMSASVVCLDRGGAGDVIRVRSQNGQIFRARIAGPALLEAVSVD